jgi:hypothetical protein
VFGAVFTFTGGLTGGFTGGSTGGFTGGLTTTLFIVIERVDADEIAPQTSLAVTENV